MKCKCPHCGTKYEFDADGLGRTETCQACGKEFAPESNKIDERGKRQNDGLGCCSVCAGLSILFAFTLWLGSLNEGLDRFLCGGSGGIWLSMIVSFLFFGWMAVLLILFVRVKSGQEMGEVQKKASQHMVDRLASLSDNMEAQKQGLQYICDRLADICDNMEKK